MSKTFREWDVTEESARAGLRYIAQSPPREDGGFHPETVATAQAALAALDELRAERDGLAREVLRLRATLRTLSVANPDDPLSIGMAGVAAAALTESEAAWPEGE